MAEKSRSLLVSDRKTDICNYKIASQLKKREDKRKKERPDNRDTLTGAVVPSTRGKENER